MPIVIRYKKRPLLANKNTIGMVLQDTHGCATLVALHNNVVLRWRSDYGQEGPVTEEALKSVIRKELEKQVPRFVDLTSTHVRVVHSVLRNIRTQFHPQPRLSGCTDFVMNPSVMLCRVLGLYLHHGWIVSPESSIYGSVKDFSQVELVDYASKLEGRAGQDENLEICKQLIDDAKDQLTSHGCDTIAANLADAGMALLYCWNRLSIVFKHAGILFLYISDVDTLNMMPDAVWLLFEKCQDKIIYFDKDFRVVKGQLCEERAKNFYKEFLAHNKGENYERNKQKRAKNKKKKLTLNRKSEPDEVAASYENEDQDKTAGAPVTHAETVVSHQTDSLYSLGSSLVDKKSAGAVVLQQSEDQGDGVSPPEDDDKAAGALVARCSEHQDANVSPAEDKTTETAHNDSLDLNSVGSSREDNNRTECVEASPCEVPEGVASKFLRFLFEFKGEGTSTPYFEGIVVAFPKHSPVFYVPYDFILAYDEELALTVRDKYSRISEDLKNSVECYLSQKKVHFGDVVLNIIGLPEPKRYMDKPNSLEDAASDIVQGLVKNISHEKRTGYVCSEVTVYSERQHVGDADMAKLETELNNNGIKCNVVHGGKLQCGSISLSKRYHPPTRKTGASSVIVVQGPFSWEYEAVFHFLTQWLCL